MSRGKTNQLFFPDLPIDDHSISQDIIPDHVYGPLITTQITTVTTDEECCVMCAMAGDACDFYTIETAVASQQPICQLGSMEPPENPPSLVATEGAAAIRYWRRVGNIKSQSCHPFYISTERVTMIGCSTVLENK